jgi:internalin A
MDSVNNFLQSIDSLLRPEKKYHLDLSSQGIGSLSKIENPTDITSLDLSYNNLVNIPDCIEELVNLTELKIFGNRLTEIPEWIGNFSKLNKLLLSSNQITTLPDSITQLSNLAQLSINKNKRLFST